MNAHEKPAIFGDLVLNTERFMEFRILRDDVPENVVNYAKNKVRRLGIVARAVELVFNHRFDHVKVIGVDEHKILTKFDVNTNSEAQRPADDSLGEEERPGTETGEAGGAGNGIDQPTSEQKNVAPVQTTSRKRNPRPDS